MNNDNNADLCTKILSTYKYTRIKCGCLAFTF